MSRTVIGVVGNPNCGKTTVFNGLTGARQRVGNWAGVTVERKTGQYRHSGREVQVVDLPGVYTLGMMPGLDSIDETIAQDYILGGEADLVVNVVDATNLERNLYLTAQLLEMRVPMVVALNMLDVARQQGLAVDRDALADRLGCPVVPLVASRGEGIAELKQAIAAAAADPVPPAATVAYAGGVEKALAEVAAAVRPAADAGGVDPRWLAAKLLEDDDLARRLAGDAAADVLARVVPGLEAELGEDADILVADGRYAFAHDLAEAVVDKAGRVGRTASDRIDRLVLNPWLGLPLFLGLMYLMFMFTINLGGAFIDFFDIAAATIFVDGFGALLDAVGTPTWLRVLLADGAGGGVQVVATFIPIIGFLYLFLSVLEDSGYMARAAFLMDRFMRAIGLPGKAFVPLIVGFGCNVPAIMATRTLEQQRDRTMSVLMAPFMSCGARLAVYALFAAAFFPVGGQNVVFALYLIGIAVAVGTGFVLKHTLLMGETTPFVMELPPYHLPNVKGLLIHTWARLKGFMFGAGKIIVAVVVVLSFLNSVGTDGSFGNEDSDRSALSAIGRAIVPVFEPMGIHDENWPATVGIFTGVFAKEAVVGTLDALYSSLAADAAKDAAKAGAKDGAAAADETGGFDLWAGLGEALATIPENLKGLVDLVADPLGITAAGTGSVEATAAAQDVQMGTFGAMVARFDGAAGAFSYLLFILLYFPCVAALGAVIKEIGPRWGAFTALWTTALAYTAATIAYQGATFARHPASAGMWIAGLLAALALAVVAMRVAGRRRLGAVAIPAE
ncbi:MAG: Fe(2+) transporter permease subunit FeoB [Hyphomicrobiales bacterium]|nr:Fe(2+) transporter permease subunit FeoB [Hyphomicrobiales bacterium]MCP5370223.1 Fe(2+) transporter permease subunit FeoB [Hyphomicrobiales bacterium]